MIKIGMIGLGGMGHGHAQTLAKRSNAKVAWVCDLIEEKARTTGELIGVKHCTDYRKWLNEVDAVWVSTEPFNRVEIVTTAAAAGKHIFTEKPIGLSLKDADAMIAAAKKAKVIYMIGYCLRYWSPYRLVRDTFASGELGELVTCWTRRFMPCDMRGRWYADQSKSGGVVLDFGSHDIDILRWIGGDAKTVFGHTSRVRDGIKADEHGTLMMKFKKGGCGTVDISWSSYVGESSFGVIGTKGSIIVGNDGVVRKRVGEKDPEQILDAKGVTSIDPTGNLSKDPHSRKQGEDMYAHFLRCVEEKVQPISNAEEGRKTLTWLAVIQSMKTGASVDITEIATAKKR